MVDCIFCHTDDPPISLLSIVEAPNFLLAHDGFPLATSHLLWIPKQHVLTFAALSKDLLKQTDEYMQKMANVFGDVLFFEHGDCGQTVKHAHLHMVPCALTTQAILDRLPKGVTTKIQKYIDIKRFTQYLFVSNQQETFIVEPTEEVEAGVLTNTVANLIGMPFPMQSRVVASMNQLQLTRKKIEQVMKVL